MTAALSFERWWVARMGTPPTPDQGQLFAHASKAYETGLVLKDVPSGVAYTAEEAALVMEACREGAKHRCTENRPRGQGPQ